MKISKEFIKQHSESTSFQTGRSTFHDMLMKHLKQARGELPVDQDTPLSKNLTQKPRSLELNDLLNNLDNLKGMDEEYFHKGIRKKTLAETFANRFGTQSVDRMKKFKPLIEAKAKKYNLDPTLLAALIKQESNFNPYAVSHCGAMGLGQLMPETARGLGVVDPFNASQNLEGAAKYLRQMLDTFGGNTTKALAAYNAGPGAVRKYGGVPPYRETQNYVRAINSHRQTVAIQENFGKKTKDA